jgi:hypothetical protein
LIDGIFKMTWAVNDKSWVNFFKLASSGPWPAISKFAEGISLRIKAWP